jgi:hypothetical protein
MSDTCPPACSLKPPASEIMSATVRCSRLRPIRPGRATAPVTDTCWLTYSATNTLTCGSFITLRLRPSAICCLSCVSVRPPARICPSRGSEIMPEGWTRAR